MCKICDIKENVISCKVTIKCISCAINLEKNLEEHPAYSEIQIPTNYCPICGKKIREEQIYV